MADETETYKPPQWTGLDTLFTVLGALATKGRDPLLYPRWKMASETNKLENTLRVQREKLARAAERKALEAEELKNRPISDLYPMEQINKPVPEGVSDFTSEYPSGFEAPNVVPETRRSPVPVARTIGDLPAVAAEIARTQKEAPKLQSFTPGQSLATIAPGGNITWGTVPGKPEDKRTGKMYTDQKTGNVYEQWEKAGWMPAEVTVPGQPSFEKTQQYPLATEEQLAERGLGERRVQLTGKGGTEKPTVWSTKAEAEAAGNPPPKGYQTKAIPATGQPGYTYNYVQIPASERPQKPITTQKKISEWEKIIDRRIKQLGPKYRLSDQEVSKVDFTDESSVSNLFVRKGLTSKSAKDFMDEYRELEQVRIDGISDIEEGRDAEKRLKTIKGKVVEEKPKTTIIKYDTKGNRIK